MDINKDINRLLSLHLKTSNVLMNNIINIFKKFFEKEPFFNKVKKLVFNYLNTNYDRHSKYLK